MGSIWRRFLGGTNPRRTLEREKAHPRAHEETQEEPPRPARCDPERDRDAERAIQLLSSEAVPGLRTSPVDLYQFDVTRDKAGKTENVGVGLTSTGHFAMAYAVSRALGNSPELAWGAALKDIIEKVTRRDDSLRFRVDDPVFRLFCEAYGRSNPGKWFPADIIGYFAALDEATFAQHVQAWFGKQPRRAQ